MALGACGRVRRERPREHAGLLAVLGLPLDLRLQRRRVAVGADGVDGRRRTGGPGRRRARRPRRGRQRGHQRVLGSDHHERGTEQGVGSGGEHLEVAGGRREAHERALRPPDPVALHELDRLGPVQPVEIVHQTVGVGGDAHHPLAQVALEDGEVADLAAPLGGHLLVGQHGAEARAPVHRRLRQVGQPLAVEQLTLLPSRQLGPGPPVGGGARARGELGLQLGDGSGPADGPVGAHRLRVVPGVEDAAEDPLRPAVELDVDGGDRPARVVRQAQPAQLPSHRGDVGLGGHAWVLAGLHGVLLGGQPERVVAKGVQHVHAVHAVVAAHHVGRDVPQRVADVQPRAGGVREHVEHVQLGAALHRRRVAHRPRGVGRLEGAVVLPALLPPLLDLGGERGGVAEGRLVGRALRHRLSSIRGGAGPIIPGASSGYRPAPAPPPRRRPRGSASPSAARRGCRAPGRAWG